MKYIVFIILLLGFGFLEYKLDTQKGVESFKNLSKVIPANANEVATNSLIDIKSLPIINNLLYQVKKYNDITESNSSFQIQNKNHNLMINNQKDLINKSSKNINKIIQARSTDERKYFINKYNTSILNNKTRGVSISNIVALVFIIVIIFMYFDFISPFLTAILFFVTIIIIVCINIAYNLRIPFNRDNQYYHTFDFKNPDKTSVLLSQANYEKSKSKCDAYNESGSSHHDPNPDNITINMSRYIDKQPTYKSQ